MKALAPAERDILLALERQRALVPDVWFDEEAAQAACAFFPTYLRFTEGEWAGQPFRLTWWQRQIVRAIFGWKMPDGTRLYREVYIEIPRKNGKTEFAAGIALLMMVADGEFGGQVYSMAVDKDQAKIVFRKAATMVAFSEALGSLLEVLKTSIYCAELQAGFYPLSSVPGSKHGFNPHAAVADELHEWKSGEIREVVHEGMGARAQPLEVLITTAGVRGDGYGWEMHEYARMVLEFVVQDPHFLAVIFGAEEDDDWTDEEVWAKANPNLDVSVKRSFLRSECEKAKQSPRKENRFRRYFLNQWTEQATRWLPMDCWDACTTTPDDPDRWKRLEDEMAGRECFGGLDLGSTSDLTSGSWFFPPVEEGGLAVAIWRFWLPEAALERADDRLLRLYRQWHAAGALILTPGNVTDYRFIKASTANDAERFVVRGLAIDRWNATQVAVELQEDGAPVQLFGQGFASMSAPTKELERLVLAGEMEHGNHPVARWNAGNVAVQEDPAGNIKPSKEKSMQKIDGIVAEVMGIGLWQAAENQKPSVYRERGALVI